MPLDINKIHRTIMGPINALREQSSFHNTSQSSEETLVKRPTSNEEPDLHILTGDYVEYI